MDQLVINFPAEMTQDAKWRERMSKLMIEIGKLDMIELAEQCKNYPEKIGRLVVGIMKASGGEFDDIYRIYRKKIVEKCKINSKNVLI